MSVAPRTKLFDTVRALIGRGFRQSEVDAIDDALDAMADPGRSASDKDRVARVSNTPRRTAWDALIGRGRISRIGAQGIALIKQFEGCARQRTDGLIEAYPDPGTGGEPWTIGWGATGENDRTAATQGSRIGPGTVWSATQCDARLERDLKRYARDVARAVGDAPTTQGQFDAMVSFHYNTGAIARATLTRKHVARDYEGAASEFRRWNKAGGRVLKGLVRRRSEEERLYRKG
ncbi:MAG: lysozyme [Pseudomonadota bacterium]